jgi:hypothetical protein
MKLKKGWLCLGICVLGVAAFGQEVISEFAKRTLDLRSTKSAMNSSGWAAKTS